MATKKQRQPRPADPKPKADTTVKATSGKDWYDGKPEALAGVIKTLENLQTVERFEDSVVLQVYFGKTGTNAGSMATAGGIKPSSYLRILDSKLKTNLVRAVVDAAAAMIVRPPDIAVSTNGATWKTEIAARKLSSFVTSVFHESGLTANAKAVFTDAATTRLGAVKFYIDDNGEIRCDRVLPHTLFWTPNVGKQPRTLFQRHGVPKDTVLAMAPEEMADAVRRLPAYRPDPAFAFDHSLAHADLVEVTEGWRLGAKGQPGRHVITAGNLVLVDEPYDLPFFPIVVYRWSESYDDFGGVSLGSQLLQYQVRINRMDQVIDEAQAIACMPQVWVQKGGETEPSQRTNRIGAINYYVGEKPVIQPGQALPAEYYQTRDKIKAEAFELAGVSQTVSSGQKPAGLNSGKALREYNDIANNRLVTHARAFEKFFEDCADVVIALAKQAYAHKTIRVRAPGTDALTEISWSDFDPIFEDKYVVEASAISDLPGHPAGRMEYISELVEQGIVKPNRAARLLRIKDLDKLEDQESAAEELALKQVETALFDGRLIPPEPLQGVEGLQLLIDLGTKRYLRAVIRGDYPEAHLQALALLIEEARLTLQQIQQPPQAAAGPATAGQAANDNAATGEGAEAPAAPAEPAA